MCYGRLGKENGGNIRSLFSFFRFIHLYIYIYIRYLSRIYNAESRWDKTFALSRLGNAFQFRNGSLNSYQGILIPVRDNILFFARVFIPRERGEGGVTASRPREIQFPA